MVEGGGSPAFPVLFFDGERETNIGDVIINPTLEYKPFQLMLSQKIGISPNQISIYLVDRKRNQKSSFSDERRRIPITGKVNFGLICRQKDCCFLVVLKRSRKSRNRRERAISGVEFPDFSAENGFHPPLMHPAPQNLILLRRNQQVPFYDQITQSELADLNERWESLRIERENHPMAMATKGNFNFNLLNFPADQSLETRSNPNMFTDSTPQIDDWYGFPSTAMMTMKKERQNFFCEECVNAEKNGATTSFHPCVNDAVIASFTTRFGPIERPIKPFR